MEWTVEDLPEIRECGDGDSGGENNNKDESSEGLQEQEKWPSKRDNNNLQNVIDVANATILIEAPEEFRSVDKQQLTAQKQQGQIQQQQRQCRKICSNHAEQRDCDNESAGNNENNNVKPETSTPTSLCGLLAVLSPQQQQKQPKAKEDTYPGNFNEIDKESNNDTSNLNNGTLQKYVNKGYCELHTYNLHEIYEIDEEAVKFRRDSSDEGNKINAMASQNNAKFSYDNEELIRNNTGFCELVWNDDEIVINAKLSEEISLVDGEKIVQERDVEVVDVVMMRDGKITNLNVVTDGGTLNSSDVVNLRGKIDDVDDEMSGIATMRHADNRASTRCNVSNENDEVEERGGKATRKTTTDTPTTKQNDCDRIDEVDDDDDSVRVMTPDNQSVVFEEKRRNNDTSSKDKVTLRNNNDNNNENNGVDYYCCTGNVDAIASCAWTPTTSTTTTFFLGPSIGNGAEECAISSGCSRVPAVTVNVPSSNNNEHYSVTKDESIKRLNPRTDHHHHDSFRNIDVLSSINVTSTNVCVTPTSDANVYLKNNDRTCEFSDDSACQNDNQQCSTQSRGNSNSDTAKDVRIADVERGNDEKEYLCWNFVNGRLVFDDLDDRTLTKYTKRDKNELELIERNKDELDSITSNGIVQCKEDETTVNLLISNLISSIKNVDNNKRNNIITSDDGICQNLTIKNQNFDYYVSANDTSKSSANNLQSNATTSNDLSEIIELVLNYLQEICKEPDELTEEQHNIPLSQGIDEINSKPVQDVNLVHETLCSKDAQTSTGCFANFPNQKYPNFAIERAPRESNKEKDTSSSEETDSSLGLVCSKELNKKRVNTSSRLKLLEEKLKQAGITDCTDEDDLIHHKKVVDDDKIADKNNVVNADEITLYNKKFVVEGFKDIARKIKDVGRRGDKNLLENLRNRREIVRDFREKFNKFKSNIKVDFKDNFGSVQRDDDTFKLDDDTFIEKDTKQSKSINVTHKVNCLNSFADDHIENSTQNKCLQQEQNLQSSNLILTCENDERKNDENVSKSKLNEESLLVLRNFDESESEKSASHLNFTCDLLEQQTTEKLLKRNEKIPNCDEINENTCLIKRNEQTLENSEKALKKAAFSLENVEKSLQNTREIFRHVDYQLRQRKETETERERNKSLVNESKRNEELEFTDCDSRVDYNENERNSNEPIDVAIVRSGNETSVSLNNKNATFDESKLIDENGNATTIDEDETKIVRNENQSLDEQSELNSSYLSVDDRNIRVKSYEDFLECEDSDDEITENIGGLSQFNINQLVCLNECGDYYLIYDELDESSDDERKNDDQEESIDEEDYSFNTKKNRHYRVVNSMRGDSGAKMGTDSDRGSNATSRQQQHNPDRDNLKSLLKKPGGRNKETSRKNRVVFNENKNEFFDADYIILIREECDYDDEDDDGICTCNQHEMVRLTCCEPNCNCNSYSGNDYVEQTPQSPKFAPPIEFVDAVTLSPPEGYKDMELGEDQILALQQMARRGTTGQRAPVCRECSATHDDEGEITNLLLKNK